MGLENKDRLWHPVMGKRPIKRTTFRKRGYKFMVFLV
jgi:hypothetical protein